MKIWLFLVIWTQMALPNWSHSQSLDQFWQDLKEQDRLESIKATCDWEIQNQRFPMGCRSYVDLIAEDPSKTRDMEQIARAIVRLCIVQASQVSSVAILKSFLNKDSLDSQCTKKVKNRLLDLLYQAEISVGPDIDYSTGYGSGNFNSNQL